MTLKMRLIGTFLLLLVVTGVSACQPFLKKKVAVTSPAPVGGVVILPPEGPAGPMAKALAGSVADALVRRGYEARAGDTHTQTVAADLVVSGRAEALDSTHAPTVAALYWVLQNGKGREIAYLTQGVRGNPVSWEYGSPELLKIVGEEAAADLSVFLGDPPRPPIVAATVLPEETTIIAPEPPVAAAPVPSPPAPPPLPVSESTTASAVKRDFGLWLDEVSGAPGNGNAALTQAIYEGLNKNKLPFAMTPGLASHYVQGVVGVEELSATMEHITIVWVVSNADGKEIGRITQRNDIPRGSLHGEWGDTAVYVARGGLEGVLAILERDLETSLAQ